MFIHFRDPTLTVQLKAIETALQHNWLIYLSKEFTASGLHFKKYNSDMNASWILRNKINQIY